MRIQDIYKLFLDAGSICTDSREVQPGSLFFALKGKNFNGNEYASDALTRGCAYSVIDERQYLKDNRTILVENSLTTLQALAEYHRRKFPVELIAITGSNGKTTTRELISAVLGTGKKVLSTHGNLNNHIGLPLTLLKLNTGTEIAVIEMGANHIGEIARLCEISKPTHGLITNIGYAHIEGFGSEEGVIKAKSELYAWLGKNKGVIFRNSDDQILNEVSPPGSQIVPYSLNESGLGNFEVFGADPFLQLVWENEGEKLELNTQLFGSYNLLNIVAAISVGIYFGIARAKIIEAIESYSPENNRSQIRRTEKKNVLVLDSYNANPSSMTVAIDSFLNLSGKEKVLILGDMFELGPNSQDEHVKLVHVLEGIKDMKVILVGKSFEKAAGNTSFQCFSSTDECFKYLKKNPLEGSLILLKGSRMMILESLVSVL